MTLMPRRAGVTSYGSRCMIELIADMWSIDADALAITSNGYTTRTGKDAGRGVMGRGVAAQARDRFPGIQQRLGELLARHGNHCFILCEGKPAIVSLPVKHAWYEKADLSLIARSARELVALTDEQGWQRVVVPRPGCGNGQLRWAQVKPVIEPIFDDRFIVVDRD